MNLVIGASGRLGSRICERLLQNGKKIRAVSRNPKKLAGSKSKGVDVIQGDLRDSSWMKSALEGVQNLFIASHGLVPPSRSNTMDSVDDKGNRQIIDSAGQAGVERMVFPSVFFASPDTPLRFGRIKHKTEEYLKESGIAYTIVRAPAFIETHAILLMGEPIRRSGKVRLLGKGTKPINWISADDIADYMTGSIDNPDMKNTIKVIGGPDVLSRIQVIEMIERALGKPVKRSHTPPGMLNILRIISRPINRGLSDLLESVVTEEKNSISDVIDPAHFDWIAPKTVEQVIANWAANNR